MRTLTEDIDAAGKYHGHVCTGIVIGVRMARLAMQLLAIDEPLKFRDSIVYVEMDRCVTDAIQIVTGCTIGHRRLKIVDFGKMAATFVNLTNNQAVRVALKKFAILPPGDNALAFWQRFADDEVFKWEKVLIHIPPEDLPGLPKNITFCAKCGERVVDSKEIASDNLILCQACAGQSYYQNINC